MLDDSGDRKDGRHTAHVARQYLGSLGKTDNGIVAVSSLWADERVYWPVPLAKGGGKGRKPVAWGNNWVVVGVLVRLPFVPQRAVCLPVLARLWRPKHPDRTKLALAVQLGLVEVQVHAVDALDLKRHVLGEDLGGAAG